MGASLLVLAAAVAVVQGDGIRLEFDEQMRSRVVETSQTGDTALGPFSDSEQLRTGSGDARSFTFTRRIESTVKDALGEGKRISLSGCAGTISKQVDVSVYPRWPNWLFAQVRFANEGKDPVEILGYTTHRYSFAPQANAPEPAFWSYQSSSHESRPDWLAPVPVGYSSSNFLGMNDSDYGGGTPIVDVWRRDVGLAVGHIELVPKQIALPVERTRDGTAAIALVSERRQTLAPGASITSVRSFVAIHHGDHFTPLHQYGQIMQAQGLKLAQSPKDAFDPIWCAWGYGRTFTPKQVFETLPVVKSMGFRWAVLDDGWQMALGDWRPRADKFPAGDADMRALVDRIHKAGMKAQLWWAPLGADSGSRTEREHPDWLLKNPDGSTRAITWWDSQYLCPAVPAVRDDAAAFVRKALVDWGFDGLKIDGQHLNAAPACSNPAHKHEYPEQSAEGMPKFFEAIWKAAQQSKPGALVEICPCGTGYSFFTLPYLNMTVGADPTSSWQVRLKGKTLKALAGDRIAYFGDHVELSDGGTDFASTFGVGGVIGTNFAWPGASGEKDPKLLLTPERQQIWSKWLRLYEDKRLTEGEYIGDWYDIGFDRPETHVVRKGDALYYAFYAPSFDGQLELRGLKAGKYRVTDYVNNRDLGVVSAPVGKLNAQFANSLLIEVRPEH